MIPVSNSDGVAPICSVRHVAVFREGVSALPQLHRVPLLVIKCCDVGIADYGASA